MPGGSGVQGANQDSEKVHPFRMDIILIGTDAEGGWIFICPVEAVVRPKSGHTARRVTRENMATMPHNTRNAAAPPASRNGQ